MAVIFNAYFGQYIVDVFSQTPRASKFERVRKSWGPNGAPGDFSRLLVFFFFSAKISVVCSEYSAARSVGGILHTAPYVFLGGE